MSFVICLKIAKKVKNPVILSKNRHVRKLNRQLDMKYRTERVKTDKEAFIRTRTSWKHPKGSKFSLKIDKLFDSWLFEKLWYLWKVFSVLIWRTLWVERERERTTFKQKRSVYLCPFLYLSVCFFLFQKIWKTKEQHIGLCNCKYEKNSLWFHY